MSLAVQTAASREPDLLDWQDDQTVSRVQRALQARTVWTDDPARAEMVQTHISTVFLTSQYVFKFKRPIDAGFVDFRALASRLHFCREELRLNRRLANEVYLDVVALRDDRGELTFGSVGEVVDYAVVMKRLPANQMLDALLRSGAADAGLIDRIAATIADFHGTLPSAQQASTFGGLNTWQQNWDENFEQTLPEVGTTIAMGAYRLLQQRVRAFLNRHRALLERRISEGFVRDGHGDLRCEHICASDPVRVIDCVEFSERFRISDVANDLAFLLMDLCAFGRPDLAARLLEGYLERTQDGEAIALIPFYCCYRAFVRGKVLGMRLRDHNLEAGQRTQITERARAFFALAAQFARQMGPPVLLLMSGLMGSGKSTVAEAIAARTGAALLSSDRIRKELASGEAAAPQARAKFAAGLYTPAWTQRTYDELVARGRTVLLAGRPVILDATFGRAAHRQQATALGKELGVDVYVIECIAPEQVTLARLADRERTGTSISDGRPELYQDQKAQFEPVAATEDAKHFVVATDQPVEAAVTALLALSDIQIPERLFGGLVPPTQHRRGGRRVDAGQGGLRPQPVR